MTSFLVYIILKLSAIASLLFWGAFSYSLYLAGGYCRVWWDTPSADPCWQPYWQGKRRKLISATVIMLVAFLLPTTREAAIMYAVPAVAESSIWDHIFGSGNHDAMEQARKWVRDTAER